MKKILIIILLIGVLNAENRIALLIGNSKYPTKYLNNPINDINLLSDTLRKLDFKVIPKPNLTRSQILKALKSFYAQIDSDTIALIYFSGHGVHSTLDNQNYLIPIGGFEALINEADLPNEAIMDSKLLASTSGAKFSILLLDACRSNDFAQTRGEKGLGQPNSRLSNDYVISYATEVGKTAEDGNTNSPYALALDKYLSSNLSIGDIFTKIRSQVSRNTNGKQKPYYSPHFDNILYLARSAKVSTPKKNLKQKNIVEKVKDSQLNTRINYYIMVGSYRDKPSPVLIKTIKNNNFSYIIRSSSNGMKRLLIGSFKTKKSVNNALVIVKDKINTNAFIIK